MTLWYLATTFCLMALIFFACVWDMLQRVAQGKSL